VKLVAIYTVLGASANADGIDWRLHDDRESELSPVPPLRWLAYQEILDDPRTFSPPGAPISDFPIEEPSVKLAHRPQRQPPVSSPKNPLSDGGSRRSKLAVAAVSSH
jgi:hypothetical protein